MSHDRLSILGAGVPDEYAVRGAAVRCLGANPEEIAVTPNAASGLGLEYAGIRIRDHQAFLTTENDDY